MGIIDEQRFLILFIVNFETLKYGFEIILLLPKTLLF